MGFKAFYGKGLADTLYKAGFIPEGTRRIVVDIQVNEAVRIYCDAYADEKLADVLVAGLLAEKAECEPPADMTHLASPQDLKSKMPSWS